MNAVFTRCKASVRIDFIAGLSRLGNAAAGVKRTRFATSQNTTGTERTAIHLCPRLQTL